MTRKLWTPQEIDYLREHYSDGYTSEIAEHLGRKHNSVTSKASALKIKKTKAWLMAQAKHLPECGAAYRFKKGCVPKIKGKKREEFLTAEQIERVKKNEFKKGRTPHNTKDRNGVIVKRKHKSGRVYKLIRLSEANWVPLHRHVWEQANGPIPANHAILFMDNDTENCSLDNLKCISKAENMLRNSRHNYPEEIIPSMLLMNQLETILKQKDNG